MPCPNLNLVAMNGDDFPNPNHDSRARSQWGRDEIYPDPWCLLVYKPHEYYSYIYYKPWLSHLISLNYISINISLSCLSHDPPIPTCWWRNCRTRHLLAGGPQGRVFRVFFAHSPPENLLKIEGYRKIWRVNEVFMFRFFEFGSLNINDLDIQ